MNTTSRTYYTAIIPDDNTCHFLTRWSRMVENALGKTFFTTQHPANFHLSTGIFRADNFPASFPQPDKHGLPKFQKKAGYESINGKVAFDLYYRKTTGECCLTLSFPFPEAEHWLNSASANPLPPHVTLGKFNTGDYSTPEARVRLKENITQGNPPFQEMPKLLEQIQAEYLGNKCCFDTHYIASTKPERKAVLSHPAMTASFTPYR